MKHYKSILFVISLLYGFLKEHFMERDNISFHRIDFDLYNWVLVVAIVVLIVLLTIVLKHHFFVVGELEQCRNQLK